ncbi:hypothetical protein [Nonomuraea sp. B1E8]|uniref:hypothetical protein n=1 Tax=unclassified Nonomuraea TaxID=2593643 RepID=UPI00325E4396
MKISPEYKAMLERLGFSGDDVVTEAERRDAERKATSATVNTREEIRAWAANRQ